MKLSSATSAVTLCLLGFAAPLLATEPSFRVDGVQEASIADIHRAMESGELTATELVQLCLDRIEAYDKEGPYINAIMTLNMRFLFWK